MIQEVIVALRLLMVVFCLLCVPFSAFARADDSSCLKIGNPLTLLDGQKLADFIKTLATDSGLCVRLVPIPIRRSEQMLLSGRLDGELLRTRLWAQSHKTQVAMVPAPAFIGAVVTVSPSGYGLNIAGLQDLQGKKVLIFDGFHWAEQKLAGLGVTTVMVSSPARFFDTLRGGTVDVGVLEKTILPYLGEQPDMDIRELEPLSYHIVLRQKHAALVAVFDAVLLKTGPLPLKLKPPGKAVRPAYRQLESTGVPLPR